MGKAKRRAKKRDCGNGKKQEIADMGKERDCGDWQKKRLQIWEKQIDCGYQQSKEIAEMEKQKDFVDGLNCDMGKSIRM